MKDVFSIMSILFMVAVQSLYNGAEIKTEYKSTSPIIKVSETRSMRPVNMDVYNIEINDTQKVILCGDSRIVGLAITDGIKTKGRLVDSINKDESIYYLAETGKGLVWLKNNIEALSKMCDSYTYVYIALGVNDLGNIDKYIELYNTLSEQLHGAKIICYKVGDVNEQMETRYGYTVKQSKVQEFNDKLEANAENYTVENLWVGNDTVDGVHYTGKVYSDTLKNFKELIKQTNDNEEFESMTAEMNKAYLKAVK